MLLFGEYPHHPEVSITFQSRNPISVVGFVPWFVNNRCQAGEEDDMTFVGSRLFYYKGPRDIHIDVPCLILIEKVLRFDALLHMNDVRKL